MGDSYVWTHRGVQKHAYWDTRSGRLIAGKAPASCTLVDQSLEGSKKTTTAQHGTTGVDRYDFQIVGKTSTFKRLVNV